MGAAKSLFGMLQAGIKAAKPVVYPDEWIDEVPLQLRKDVAKHNEGLLGKLPTIEGSHHGSAYAGKIRKEGVDPATFGKGNDQYGSGFYTTTARHEAQGYAERPVYPSEVRTLGEPSPDVIDTQLVLKDPLRVDAKKVRGFDDLPVELSKRELKEMMMRNPEYQHGVDSDEFNVLGDYFEEFWDAGPQEWMFDELATRYEGQSLSAIQNDLFKGQDALFMKELSDATGYDGVIVDFGGGLEHRVAWKPEQVRDADAVLDPAKAQSKHLLASGKAPTAATGLMGISALSQGQDALLSPAESAYLKEQDKVSGLLGAKDTGAYNYADILPMKRHKETGDYSFAMTGLLEDAVRALADLGQSSKTGVVKPTSFWDL